MNGPLLRPPSTPRYQGFFDRYDVWGVLGLQVPSILWVVLNPNSAYTSTQIYAFNMAVVVAGTIHMTLPYIRWNKESGYLVFGAEVGAAGAQLQLQDQGRGTQLMYNTGRVYGVDVPQLSAELYAVCAVTFSLMLFSVGFIAPLPRIAASAGLGGAWLLWCLMQPTVYLASERHGPADGHTGWVIYHILAVLALCPTGETGRACVQVICVCTMFCAGMSKLFGACVWRRRWPTSETMLYYLYQAMFLRPFWGGRKALREYVATWPYLLALGAWSGLVLELVFPLAWLLPYTFIFLGVLFHYLVFTFSGIEDFARTHMLPLGSFAAGAAAWDAARSELASGDVGALLAAAYTAVQTVIALGMWDFFPSLPQVSPFISYPMFWDCGPMWGPGCSLDMLYLHVPDGSPMPDAYYNGMPLCMGLPGMMTGERGANALLVKVVLATRLTARRNNARTEFISNVAGDQHVRSLLDSIFEALFVPAGPGDDRVMRVKELIDLYNQAQSALELCVHKRFLADGAALGA